MENELTVDRLLKNMGNMHELGRQRAFELGNPFYAQFDEDDGYYRKEMPDGRIFIVDVEIVMDDNDRPVEIRDTFIRQLK